MPIIIITNDGIFAVGLGPGSSSIKNSEFSNLKI
jgi:hypothetical protein